MENYYEILDIDSSVSEQDIKKAYISLLRKYPPEKCPEEFQKIREAYETLGNPKARAEYNALSKYKYEIDSFLNTGKQAMDDENYKKAIIEFKKILVIEPSLSFARNFLGLALLYDNQIEPAISQFERLIKDNDTNSIYFYNLAITYKKNNNYVKAEQMISKAWERDRINPDIVLEYSNLFVLQQKYDKAIEILRKAVEYDRTVDFQDFIYLFEMVHVYLYSNSLDKCEAVISEIEKTIANDREAEKYVAWQFGKLASKLDDLKKYKLAIKILKWACEIDPSNEDLKKLYDICVEEDMASELWVKLEKDSLIPDAIKGPIFFYLFNAEDEDEDEDEREANRIKNLEVIESYIENSPQEVIEGVNRIRKLYKMLYEYDKDRYEEMFKLAYANQIKGEQWNRLKDDSNIVNSMKRLVALWLSKELSKEKRNEYFNSIIDEINGEDLNSLLYSINRIESEYSGLYKLNDDYLEELRKSAQKLIDKKYNSSKLNNSSTTNTSSPSNQSQSSSNSSCFVATAAFGTPWAEEIDVLRAWRDQVLMKSIRGRDFIRFYYIVGPYFAKIVEKSETLAAFTRNRYLYN